MPAPRDNAPMCNIHLVETSRALRLAPPHLRCCFCDATIHGEALYVEGHLDDGSPGLYRFAYHEDCAWDMEHDDMAIDAHDGCFNYGTPLSVETAIADAMVASCAVQPARSPAAAEAPVGSQ